MLWPHRRGSLRGRLIQEPASSPDLDTESIDSSSRPTALPRDHAAAERRPASPAPSLFSSRAHAGIRRQERLFLS